MSRQARVLAASALSCVLALATLGASATAARDQRPPAGIPDPEQMVLRSADLGGARVTAQRYYKDTEFPSVISYLREFARARVGAAALVYVDSEAEVGTGSGPSSAYLRALGELLVSEQVREEIAESFAEDNPTNRTVRNVRVGRPRGLGVGADSFDVLITARTRAGARLEAHIGAFRVERVIAAVLVAGVPGERVSRSLVARLARIVEGRIGAQLAPRSTGAPVVSGTVAVGQPLTTTRGTWSGTPTSFAFQWQRCDAQGLSCTAIPGATGERYVVGEADIGVRIRATVSARNAFGTGASRSAPTAVVPERAPPTNVSPPTISGTPQVGQTLTAQGAGTWTGNPTGFTFRWLRCDAAGGACTDIPGASGGTYAVVGADVGSTIRVAVTARNAAGEATAVSAQTAVVT